MVRVNVLVCSILGLSAVTSCSPLPGPTLDPMYLQLGAQQRPEATTRSSPTTVTPAPQTAPAPNVASRVATIPSGRWAGRYRDSRGEGEMTVILVPTESGFSGTWTIRAGGSGSLVGRLGGSGGRMTLHIENTAPGCHGTFDGWAETKGTTLVGAYHGTDCEGSVSDGWLELHPRQP